MPCKIIQKWIPNRRIKFYKNAFKHFCLREKIEKPPVSITERVAEIEWEFNNGHCDRLPKSNKPISDIKEVKLIPYGCPNLRMTEIPFVKQISHRIESFC